MARRQKYKFAKKEYAKQGKISVGVAAGSLVLLLTAVILSVAFSGNGGVLTGGIGLMSMLLSVLGFFAGIRGYSEKHCSYLFCAVGVIANGLICITYLALISLGAA